MHLDPHGPSRESIVAFKKRGGTHLIVVHKPYSDIPISSLDDYRRSYQQTVDLTDKARSLGVTAWCLLGPYPVELVRMAKEHGLEMAMEIQLGAVELALELVDDGSALGVGEVGRVHFPVDDEVQNACDEVMLSAFRGCRTRSCPVQLHTESLRDNPDLMAHIAGLADEAGMPRQRVIKHYSGHSMIHPGVNHGLSASVQANRKNLKEVFTNRALVLLETDYIDDPLRPGFVMPLDTIPKKMEWGYRTGLMDDEYHRRLMVDLPDRVLGIDTQCR
ncbi:MAG: TatD family hydrolase [Thermoplasmata archaeon]|nr:TatD family hydrolase [Thermoplasmata archaeon]